MKYFEYINEGKGKLYFAHPRATYNTPIEKTAQAILRKEFPELMVITPNQDAIQGQVEKIGFDIFFQIIDTCDVLVGMTFKDGKWGGGMHREGVYAEKKGKKVYELNPYTGEFKEVKSMKAIRPLSAEDTFDRIPKKDQHKWNVHESKIAKRMKIEDEFIPLGFYQMFDQLDEAISDDTFHKLQSLGFKFGIKVRRSKTFLDILGNAGKGVLELMKLVAHYSVEADLLDTKARKKLESDIKQQFSKVKREDVIAFIVNVDKTFLGLTSIPRHVLQNLLGIQITSYDNWQSHYDYIEKNMEKMIAALQTVGDEKDIILAKQIYQNVTGRAYGA